MPEQLISKPSREAIDAYHRSMRHVIDIVRSWNRDDFELQEFLDYDKDLFQEPKAYRSFHRAWDATVVKGKQAKIFQMALSDHALKFVAKEIWGSESRMRFYTLLLEGKLRCASADVEPVSTLELEQRYQYSLYQKGRKQRGLEPGPNFEVWCHTPDRTTFYDSLPRR